MYAYYLNAPLAAAECILLDSVVTFKLEKKRKENLIRLDIYTQRVICYCMQLSFSILLYGFSDDSELHYILVNSINVYI